MSFTHLVDLDAARGVETLSALRRGETMLEKRGNTSQLHHSTSLVTVA
jgi:hypothetical protein